MPQAMRCESVLDWQPAGERRVVGGLFAAASAVADVGLVGDCVAVEPEPDGASAAPRSVRCRRWRSAVLFLARPVE